MVGELYAMLSGDKWKRFTPYWRELFHIMEKSYTTAELEILFVTQGLDGIHTGGLSGREITEDHPDGG